MSTGNVEPMQLSLDQNRESGIVDVVERATVEREASPVTGAVEPGKPGERDIDIDTDLSGGKLELPASDAGRSAIASDAASDDAVIEVADDDIETADEAPARPTQPSIPAASSVLRSRPPARPSARPRSEAGGGASLPPPTRFSTMGSLMGPGSASSLPPPSSRNDPWALANKTLELSRANAYIAELEELVAFRDARILTLEERLQAAYARLDGLEQKLGLSGPAERRAAPPVNTSGSEAVAANPAAQHTASSPKPSQAGTSSNEGANPAWSSEEEEEDLEDDAQGADADSTYLEGEAGPNAVSGSADRASGTEEDLRVIAGIGPRFEAALRKHGVTRLSQIASWSDADVRQVAKALKIPKSRIVKGRWIESAREAIGTRAASE